LDLSVPFKVVDSLNALLANASCQLAMKKQLSGCSLDSRRDSRYFAFGTFP
jgi:hypothetical protein